MTGSAVILLILLAALFNFYPKPDRTLIPHAARTTMLVQVAIFLAVLLAGNGRLPKRAGPRNSSPAAFTRLRLVFLSAVIVLAAYVPAGVLLRGASEGTVHDALYMFGAQAMLAWLVLCDSTPMLTLHRVMVLLVVLGTALALLGMFTGTVGTDPAAPGPDWLRIEQMPVITEGHLRVSSVTGNPNVLAVWLFLSLMAATWLILVERWHRVPVGAMALVQVCGLALTASRAGTAATILGVGLLLASRGAQRLGWRLCRVVPAVIALGLFGILLVQLSGAEFFGRSLFSAPYREQLWSTAWSAFRAHPLFGVGYGTSYELVFLPRGLPFIHAHDLYLTVLSELGLVGFALLGAIIGAGALAAWRLRRARSPSQREYAAFVGILVIALAAHEIFESIFLVPYHQSVALTLVVCFFLSLSVSLYANPDSGAAWEDASGTADPPARAPAGQSRPPGRSGAAAAERADESVSSRAGNVLCARRYARRGRR